MTRIQAIAGRQAAESLVIQDERARTAAAQASATAELTDRSLATVEQLEAWGDEMDVPTLVGRLATDLCAIRPGAKLTATSFSWMPYARATQSWNTLQQTGEVSEGEVMGLRGWYVQANTDKLPDATISLYQVGTPTEQVSRLAITQPNLGIPGSDGKFIGSFHNLLLNDGDAVGRRKGIVESALAIDESLQYIVDAEKENRTWRAVRPRDNSAKELSNQIEAWEASDPAQLKNFKDKLAQLYYTVQLCYTRYNKDDKYATMWTSKEEQATQLLLRRDYRRLARFLGVQEYGTDTYIPKCDDDHIYASLHTKGRSNLPVVDKEAHNFLMLRGYLLDAAKSGYISTPKSMGDGNYIFGPEYGDLGIKIIGSKPMPAATHMPGMTKLGVHESNRHLPELQAALQPNAKRKLRWSRAGGVVGRYAVAVSLGTPAGTQLAQEKLEHMLDDYYADSLEPSTTRR